MSGGGGGGAVRALNSQGGGAVARLRKRLWSAAGWRGWATRLSPIGTAIGLRISVARWCSAQPGMRWGVGLA